MNDARAIRMTVNGRAYDISAPPNQTLLDFLRYRLGLVGTKNGCDTGNCGACTVLVDGKAVNSCLVLAVELDGAGITTIEGIGSPDRLHPLQQAFVDHGVIQCGYCAPGMIIAAKALLDENAEPTEEEIRSAIAGNLCRCTGYLAIMKAIASAAGTLRGEK